MLRKTLRRDESGGAMVASLLIMLMLGLVGIAAVKTSVTDMDIAKNYNSKVKSFYVAQAGAERSLAVVQDSSWWRAGFTSEPFAGGAYHVTITDSNTVHALAETLLVLSHGTRSDAITDIEMKLIHASRPYYWAGFGNSELEVEHTSFVDSYDSDSGSYAATKLNAKGDVGSNGELEVENNSQVYGNASTSSPGQLNIMTGGTVTGDTTSRMAHFPLPPVPAAELTYAQNNNAAPMGLSGGYSYNSGTHTLSVAAGQTLTLASGVYYISTLTINGTLKLAPGASVKLYVTGSATVGNGALVNSNGQPQNLEILGNGTGLSADGAADLRAIVYMPLGEVESENGGNLYGSFMGNEVEIEHGSHIHFDRALTRLSNKMKKVGWREV